MAKRKNKVKIDEEAARAAAEEAVEELENDEVFDSPEDRDLKFALNEQNLLSDREVNEKDIFSEAKKKAFARSTSVQFRIYRDGAWVGTKPSSYTWEKVRHDFGKNGGHFKVVAVDGDNQFIGSQSLEVAAPEVQEGYAPQAQSSVDTSLQMMELMKENQREAEAKAQSQQTGIASIFSSMIQMQTQSTQTMIQMFQESSKQTQSLIMAMLAKKDEPRGPDPMVTLLTTLLTKKDDGFNATTVIKMLEDAKRDARNQAREDARHIEEKARKYAEEMTPENTGEESFAKTIIRAVAPVLADIAKNNQQSQFQNQRALPGNAGLNQGFIEGQEFRPAIPAGNPRRAPAPAPRRAPGVEPRPVQNGAVSGGATVPGGVMRPAPVVAENVEKGLVAPPPAQELPVDGRLQITIFNFCASDIGNALLTGASAKETAALCLAKLEKEGISRQTVAKAFTLEDFYRIGASAGVPEIAQPWLKEFYESVALEASEKSVRVAPDTGAAARSDGPDNGHVGTNGAGAVASPRGETPRPRTRTQPRDRVKNL